MRTTLNKLRAHNPCADGWKKLLSGLGKTEADDEPLSIATILDINGLNDALWALRAVDGYDREIRLLAVWCARQVRHLLTDTRSVAALDVAERCANGKATPDELAAALDAAWDVPWAAARAASWDAASDAAWAAARAASWDAAWAAARVAARVAARAAWAAQEIELRRLCAEIDSREVES